MRRLPSQANKQRGLAIVEFAIGVPILIFVLLVVAEFGRMFYQYTTLTQSVRNGARYISRNVYGGTSGVYDLTNTAADVARQLVVTGNLVGGTPILPGMTVNDVQLFTRFPSGPGNPYIEVQASYAYQPMMPFVPIFWSGGDVDMNFTLNTSNIMRAQE